MINFINERFLETLGINDLSRDNSPNISIFLRFLYSKIYLIITTIGITHSNHKYIGLSNLNITANKQVLNSLFLWNSFQNNITSE